MLRNASWGLATLLGSCLANPLVSVDNLQNLNAEEANALIEQDQKIAIVDVRTPGEFAQGHLKGANSLPVGEINQRATAMLPDKEQKILVYCGTGKRSRMAIAALEKMGYSSIYNLSGGLNHWSYGLVKQQEANTTYFYR